MAIRKTFTNENFVQAEHGRWDGKGIESFTLVGIGDGQFSFSVDYYNIMQGGTGGLHSGGFDSLYDFDGNPNFELEGRTGLKWDSLKILVENLR